MKRYHNIHALVRADERKGSIGEHVICLLDSLKNQVEHLTLLIPDETLKCQRSELLQHTSSLYTYSEFDDALREQDVFCSDKVLVFDEFCFGPADRESVPSLLEYLDKTDAACCEILPGHCVMVDAMDLTISLLRTGSRRRYLIDKSLLRDLQEDCGLKESSGLVFFSITDLMDTDLNRSSCENPRNMLEEIAQTGYDTKLIWDYLLARYHIEDIKNALHLEYIFPWKQCLGKAGEGTAKKTALIAHLHYEEMTEDCFRYLSQLPPETDLYITTSNERIASAVEILIGRWKRENCHVIIKENRGRDVSALLVACHDRLMEYEYLGFVHDKKSAGYLEHKSESDSFRYAIWENMLKSEDYIRNVLNCFEENPRLGLLVPPEPYYASLMGYLGKSWGRCYEKTREFAGQLDLDCPMAPEKLPVTVSTTFWCRTEALKPLFARQFHYEEFPREPMSADGTFSHVIEHILAYAAQSRRFYTGIVMNDEYASLRGSGLQMLLIRALNEMRKEAVILKPAHINGYSRAADRLISFRTRYEKVYIYGTGTYGKRCFEVLNNHRIRIDGFVVSDGSKTRDWYEGLPVYGLSELQEEPDRCGMILALNTGNEREVVLQLEKKGYKNRYSMVHETLTIGNIVLNMQYYDGADQYTDGDIEDEILKIVERGSDYEQELNQCSNFAVFYHLSKEREFITEVMDISKSDRVLEIGAGCGAITGALAERAGLVQCIELSEKRSIINACRNQSRDNIEIYVGNYEDIVLDQSYDVITLIGVFEYACEYIHDKNPYHTMLSDISRILNPGGRIYVAIENRLGLKYFAGCKEDHAGTPFEGIEGYPSFTKARTFSYYELIQLFQECGFTDYEFYYPYPDYKFPTELYSDQCLPERGELMKKGSNYTSSRHEYFDERRFMDQLVMDDEFKLFSNSYLICLRK